MKINYLKKILLRPNIKNVSELLFSLFIFTEKFKAEPRRRHFMVHLSTGQLH